MMVTSAGLGDGHAGRSKAMTEREKMSAPLWEEVEENICVRQLTEGDGLPPKGGPPDLGGGWRRSRCPGRRGWWSRKYMGFWRRDSQLTVTMMERLPSRVAVYTNNSKRNKSRLRSLDWVSLRKINSLTPGRISCSIGSWFFLLFSTS